MIRPRPIKFGDTIGLIAPSSPTEAGNVDKAHNKLKEMGFKVKMGKSPYERYGYLSGRDHIRAEDINSMFGDREVDGIICLRGGYGTPRILDLLDYDLIRENPKVFLGYSDITALHIAFNQICQLVTFHGPMVTSDMIKNFSDFSRESLYRAIMDDKIIGDLVNPEGEDIVTINGGLGEGPIIGGNLSLIVDTLATPYEIDVKDKLIFIEEIDEEPYNVDRMMNQLRLAGKFNDASGIILGDFNGCEAKKPDKELSLMEVFKDQLRGINKPIIYNFQAGHCSPMVTLPFGVRARLDGDRGLVTILDKALE